MAKQKIEFGTNPNDGTGDTLRSGAVKVNQNFDELYGFIGLNNDVTFVNSITAGNGISVSSDTGNITITNTKPMIDSYNSFRVSGQDSLSATAQSQAVTVVAGGIVTLTTNAQANTLTISATQLSADWDATSGPTAILHKPTIPAAQIQSDWTQSNNTAVDFIKHKPVIFYDIDEMSDINGRLPGKTGEYKITTWDYTLDPSEVKVIATALVSEIVGMRIMINVGVPDASGNLQVQLAEMTVARTIPASGAPTIVSSVYGLVYTSVAPLATFEARWNGDISRIEIVATNPNSASYAVMSTKAIVTEYLAVSS